MDRSARTLPIQLPRFPTPFCLSTLIGSLDTNGGMEVGILLVSLHTEDMTLLDCPRLPDQMDDQGSNQSCLKEQNLA